MKRNWSAEELIAFEANVAELFKKGEINCPVHLSGGNESTLISLFQVIENRDYVLSTHRNHYHYLLKGGNPKKLMDELMGKPTGVCKGQGRSMHIYDPSIKFYTSGIVGGICAIAIGLGLAIKNKWKKGGGRLKSNKPHVWVFVGDGAEDSGHMVEAVRFALARKLPVSFTVEDNDFACDTTKKMRWHNFAPMEARNVLRYKYKRIYPHVGVGEHVSF